MRLLIFGGSGMLGTDLRAMAPREAEVVAPTSAEVDVGDLDALARCLDGVEPRWVINAAAYTDVDGAESRPELAWRANAEAPGLIGRACASRGVSVTHISTDYVFSGRARRPYLEADDPDPVNAYGRSKLAGERALLESGADTLIVRTGWLFGINGRSFPRTMAERARRRERTRVVDDQIGRPTGTDELAGAIWSLMERGITGIVHAGSSGPHASWFDVAARIFAQAGAGGLLERSRSADMGSAAARPPYSVLATERLEAVLGHALSDWRVALDRFLGRLAIEKPIAPPG